MTANKRCLGTSFTVMKPLIKITRRCARPCFSGNSGLLFAQLFMLASASFPLHDLSFLILVGLLVKFALHDFAFPIDCYSPVLAMSLHSQVRVVLLGTRIFVLLLTHQNFGSASFQGLFQGLITDLTGMCRPGWCPANKPKVAKRFRHPMSELFPHTASSTCLSTRSLECISEGKVCVKQCCMRKC